MRVEQCITVRLEHHGVPLYDCLLSLGRVGTFRLKFLFKTSKNKFVFFFCFENLNYGVEESLIKGFDQLVDSGINFGVF